MYDASYKVKPDTRACSASRMQDLNETKEYRVIATCALRQVLRDPSLSDSSVRVWLTIYELAARNDGMKIIISVRRLQEILGKSESSVRRAVRQLEVAGYLKVGTRRTSVMGQGANSLAPRLPHYEAERLFHTATTRASAASTVTDSHGPRLSKTPEPVPENANVPVDPVETDTEKGSNLDSQPVSLKREATVAGRDKNALRDAKNYLDKIAEQEKKELWKTLVKNDKEGAVKNDTHYSTSLNIKTNSSCSEIRFPMFLEKRTVSRLRELGFQGGQLGELLSQVRYSVEKGVFGSHTPEHGVNVCLKLISRNDWRAPKGWV